MKFPLLLAGFILLNIGLLNVGYDCLAETLNESFIVDEILKILGSGILVIILYVFIKRFKLLLTNNPNKEKIFTGLALLPMVLLTIFNLSLIKNYFEQDFRKQICRKVSNFDLFSSGSMGKDLSIEEYKFIIDELPLPKIPQLSSLINYSYRHTDEFFGSYWFDLTFHLPGNITMAEMDPELEYDISVSDSIQVVRISKSIN